MPVSYEPFTLRDWQGRSYEVEIARAEALKMPRRKSLQERSRLSGRRQSTQLVCASALIGLYATAIPIPLSARAAEPITELGRARPTERIIPKAPLPHRDFALVGYFLCEDKFASGRETNFINRLIGGKQRPFTGQTNCSTYVERCRDWRNPRSVIGLQGLLEGMVRHPQDQRVYYGGQKQESRESDEPARESVDWVRLFKPPWLAFLFGLCGVGLTIAGFVLLFGPHASPMTKRRSNSGVVFYFFGFAIVVAAAGIWAVL